MTSAINNNFGMHTEDSRVFVLALSAPVAVFCLNSLSSTYPLGYPQVLGPLVPNLWVQ